MEERQPARHGSVPGNSRAAGHFGPGLALPQLADVRIESYTPRKRIACPAFASDPGDPSVAGYLHIFVSDSVEL